MEHERSKSDENRLCPDSASIGEIEDDKCVNLALWSVTMSITIFMMQSNYHPASSCFLASLLHVGHKVVAVLGLL